MRVGLVCCLITMLFVLLPFWNTKEHLYILSQREESLIDYSERSIGVLKDQGDPELVIQSQKLEIDMLY